jgi:hypothetical protein
MREYRAYLIGPDGRITQRAELIFANDEAARSNTSGSPHHVP